MSRTRRKGRQITTLPLLLIALALAVLVGVLFAVRPGTGRSFTPAITGAPGLEVEQSFFDIGDQHFDRPVRVTYNLRNVGDQPLRILQTPQVEVLEGCWPPVPVISSMTINPGQRGTITLEFMMHAGMDGQHDFRLQLQTNDPAQPVTELRVRSNWIP